MEEKTKGTYDPIADPLSVFFRLDGRRRESAQRDAWGELGDRVLYITNVPGNKYFPKGGCTLFIPDASLDDVYEARRAFFARQRRNSE